MTQTMDLLMTEHPYGADVQRLQDSSRWRSLQAWEGAGGVFLHDGKTYLNFSSNDYLNLSGNFGLQTAVTDAMRVYGCGATASRLMSGSQVIHTRLEGALAALTGQECALVFPSGYQANVGVLTSLAGVGDTIFSDALNHASIIDGARLSRATVQVYGHNDMAQLEQLLAQAPVEGRRIIVTDTVFSMDGDLAPVEALSNLADAYNAILVVDEAHAIGIWGAGGGLCRHVGVLPSITLGTLGKALGSGGGFVACDPTYRDLLINRARSFIYSTGVSPMNSAAALAAVELVGLRKTLGETLLQRARTFREMLAAEGVNATPGDTQIIPIVVGSDTRAMALAEVLQGAGLIATGIRPPTVPEGTSRLRLSVTLAHDEKVLTRAAAILGRVLKA